METKNDTSGVFVLRQDLEPMKERHMEQDYPKRSKERGGGISDRRTTAAWSKKVEEGACVKGTVRGWRRITLSLNTTGEPPRQISGMR